MYIKFIIIHIIPGKNTMRPSFFWMEPGFEALFSRPPSSSPAHPIKAWFSGLHFAYCSRKGSASLKYLDDDGCRFPHFLVMYTALKIYFLSCTWWEIKNSKHVKYILIYTVPLIQHLAKLSLNSRWCVPYIHLPIAWYIFKFRDSHAHIYGSFI